MAARLRGLGQARAARRARSRSSTRDGRRVELRAPDLAQLALDPVADDGVPGRLRHREAEPRLAGLARRARTSTGSGSASRRAAVAVDGVEVARAGEAVLALHCTARLGREALAALGAAALEDHAAGARRHPGAEAVLALPPAHVWLIGPFHRPRKGGKAGISRRPDGQYRRTALDGCPQAASVAKAVERRPTQAADRRFPHLWRAVWRTCFPCKSAFCQRPVREILIERRDDAAIVGASPPRPRSTRAWSTPSS